MVEKSFNHKGEEMTLQEFFTENPRIAIAFSGGTDSAYLAYMAKKYAKEMTAIYVSTAFQPTFEKEDALTRSIHKVSPRSVERRRFTEAQAEREMFVGIILKPFFFRYKLADAILRTHPKISFVVLTNREQYVRRQTVLYTI